MAILNSSHSHGRWTLRPALALMAALLALAGLTVPASAQQAVDFNELKAAFVFQFANYVQWPESAFKEPASPIVIGIVGNEAMLKTLSASVRGKSVGSHPIEVVSVASDKSIEKCQILFVDASDEKRVAAYLEAAHTKPVLTVSDADGFTSEGGMIRLFKQDKKLRFEVNVDEVQRSSLTISTKLLGLAQVVHDKN